MGTHGFMKDSTKGVNDKMGGIVDWGCDNFTIMEVHDKECFGCLPLKTVWIENWKYLILWVIFVEGNH